MKAVRGLSAAEIALAQTVFQHGIDYAAVRIYAGAWWLRSPNMAVAPGNGIYFPAAHCCADFAAGSLGQQAWLIHELTHVWQHQHGFPLWWGGLLLGLRGAYLRRRGYRYPPPVQIAHLGCLNMEQQADVLAHYFLACQPAHTPYQPHIPQYRRLLRPFWANPHDARLLPHY